uniref:RING-type E3 ubiquitin transferase n=1 Tax=Nicotiana tabacum TaxID=4097 RepID=A0A1S3XS76_TOBAC|nr:PREDICTED: putative RING-H2 finger protein ATL21A [Nicotiana tabacum]
MTLITLASFFQQSQTRIFLCIFFLFIFYFTVLSLSLQHLVFSKSYCPKNKFPIRFPFYLENQQPQNCGYPGFNLKCNSQGYTVLNLPFSGEFLVQTIRYSNPEIKLYDADNCLARRLMDLNLSSSPFEAYVIVNYTILSCPSEYPLTFRSLVVDCLSNYTTDLLAFYDGSDYEKYMPGCNVTARNFSIASNDLKYSDLFGLSLTWSVPNCTTCEAKFELCGFENYSTNQEIRCFGRPKSGSSEGQPIAKVIALSVAIPISLLLLLIFGLSLRIYCNKRREASS